jgi:hypothetical protein
VVVVLAGWVVVVGGAVAAFEHPANASAKRTTANRNFLMLLPTLQGSCLHNPTTISHYEKEAS